jgi:hypothetical protein
MQLLAYFVDLFALYYGDALRAGERAREKVGYDAGLLVRHTLRLAAEPHDPEPYPAGGRGVSPPGKKTDKQSQKNYIFKVFLIFHCFYNPPIPASFFF